MPSSAPMLPLILALETATAVSSVALYAGDRLLGLHELHADKLHAKLITLMASRMLEDLGYTTADLGAVGLSGGPGSYTGLRVGVSTAKGLCMALDIPLIAVGSLEALAWGAADLATRLDAWVCPLIDARRMEVYCAFFDAAMQVQVPVQAQVVGEGSFAEILDARRVVFVGDGAAKCAPFLQHPNAIVLPQALSSAGHLGTVLARRLAQGQVEDLVAYEPMYLKDVVATQSKKNQL